MGKGLVCPHIAAHLFIRTVFGEAYALHHQLPTVLEPADLKVEALIRQQLLLKSQLRVYCFFAAALQTLIKRNGRLY